MNGETILAKYKPYTLKILFRRKHFQNHTNTL